MEKPFVVCHMLIALDGKIDGGYMLAPENMPALRAYGELRGFYDCQATLYGTTTAAEGYADGYLEAPPDAEGYYPREDYAAPTDVQNYVVAIDALGTLCWHNKYLERKNRPKAHVIAVVTDAVPDRYIAYLRSLDISYIFAGSEQLDCAMMLHKLKTLFGIERLMLAGGGLMNWSLLQEDLIDELSLVLSPTADGSREAATLFEKSDFLPSRPPAAFTLKAVEAREGSVVWLRYDAKR